MSYERFTRKFCLAFLFLITTVAYYIFTQHEAHILTYSSYIIVIIFILVHLLMHRGHNHGGHGGNHEKENKNHGNNENEF